MSSKIKKSILRLKESSTLVINEKCKDLIQQGKKVYNFGFGQSPFPVPKKIVEALKDRGIEVPYMVKDNEGHGFSNEENKFEFYQEMEKFLEQHLQY